MRKWHSPKGLNLYATLYFTVPFGSAFLPNLAQLLSISCSKTLEILGFSPEIKWPNDLLLERKKVAGILCETVQVKKDLLGIALGIGLNMNMDEETAKLIDQPTTSLMQISKTSWSSEKILAILLPQFIEDLSLLQKEGFKAFHSYYEARLAFKGELILRKEGEKILSGICLGVSEEGLLKVELPTGELINLTTP